MSATAAALQEFVSYVKKHLSGDEKGEAADFLDHLFRALGHDGIKEAGASRETRVAKKGGGKGKNYTDLLWPQRVLIEMKSRRKKLEKYYDQIFNYWTHIVPHRPPYVIICNFDHLWIYDFNIQLFEPVEKIALADLPDRAEALAFLLPLPRKPLFNNNRVDATRQAAGDLAAIFRSLVARGEDRTRAQRFILQLLVTLVSEDLALLPRQLLTRLVNECMEKGESAYDLLGGLFRQMNDETPARAGCFKEMPYFNGGLFSNIDPIELLPAELMNAVSIQQFYGMDLLPFAAELAKVTLMVAKEMWVMENSHAGDSESLFARETPLPLDNLDLNIFCADALFTPWPEADAIVGNPPYLGAKRLKPEYGAEYVKRIRKAYPEIPGMADFCVYWFRKAHDHLASEGRAGLVGTQNIRSNASRIGGLDYITATGTIIEAVSAQVWSGEAAVHVSIVNWIKGICEETKTLAYQRGDSTDSPWEIFELLQINASLSNELDVTAAARLLNNYEPQRCFSGQFPRNHGFLIDKEGASKMIHADQRNADVVHPFFIGAELLTKGSPQRWVIDFQKLDLFDAQTYQIPFEHVRKHVLPHVSALAQKEFSKSGKKTGQDQLWLQTWWQHFRCRKDMVDNVSQMTRYIACSDTTKRPIFGFISPSIRPDHKLRVFAFEDDYSFGILQSEAHWLWFVAKCSKLKGDFNYTSSTVFDTFPWPQAATRKQIEAVAKEAVALRQLRREVMEKMSWSLRDLYRTLDEPGANPLREAQAKLDAAVRAAYAMPKGADILAFLLALNQTCAAKEAAGEPITPPGLPLPPEEHAAFVTEDCIRV